MIYEVSSNYSDLSILTKKTNSLVPEKSFQDVLAKTISLENSVADPLEIPIHEICSQFLSSLEFLVNVIEKSELLVKKDLLENFNDFSHFLASIDYMEFLEMPTDEDDTFYTVISFFNYLSQNILSENAFDTHILESFTNFLQNFKLEMLSFLESSKMIGNFENLQYALDVIYVDCKQFMEENLDNFDFKMASKSDFIHQNLSLAESAQKLTIHDGRTKSFQERDKFFLDHPISETNSVSEIEAISENFILSSSDVVSSDTNNLAEKMYTTFSSSVSRVHLEALVNNISGRVSILLQDGRNEFSMKLTPPELGQMKMTFVTEDNIMQGKIVVETQEAKWFFDQNINSLKETLTNSGIFLGHVSVELGSNAEFSQDQNLETESYQAIRTGKSVEKNTARSTGLLLDTLVDFTA